MQTVSQHIATPVYTAWLLPHIAMADSADSHALLSPSSRPRRVAAVLAPAKWGELKSKEKVSKSPPAAHIQHLSQAMEATEKRLQEGLQQQREMYEKQIKDREAADRERQQKEAEATAAAAQAAAVTAATASKRKQPAQWLADDMVALVKACQRIVLPEHRRGPRNQREAYVAMTTVLNNTYKSNGNEADRYTLDQVQTKYRTMVSEWNRIQDAAKGGETAEMKQEWWVALNAAKVRQDDSLPPPQPVEDGLSVDTAATIHTAVTPQLQSLRLRYCRYPTRVILPVSAG